MGRNDNTVVVRLNSIFTDQKYTTDNNLEATKYTLSTSHLLDLLLTVNLSAAGYLYV